VNIVARKLAITVLGKMTKVFTDNGDGSYTLENLSAKKNMSWRFKLDEQFETQGFDDKMHKVRSGDPIDGLCSAQITFRVDNGDVIEEHIVDGESESPVRYKLEGGYLVAVRVLSKSNHRMILLFQHLQAGDVRCQRYFKRQ
jgi:hypothetical protein